jgi:hypothetical protein
MGSYYDGARIHIGSEEWTLAEFVDAFKSYRDRAEKAERERDEALEEERLIEVALHDDTRKERDRLADALDKKSREVLSLTDKLRFAREDKAIAGCRSCEGPLSCAKCVTEPDETDTHEDRIADLEMEVADLRENQFADHEARVAALEAFARATDKE